MASALPIPGVEEDVKCPICLELFAYPVTLDCGHNFCRGCVSEYCDKWEGLGELECPACRVKIKDRNFRLNWQLANIVEDVQRAKKHVCMKLEKEIYLCGKHEKELNLFCKTDDELLCVACERSPMHRGHDVVLVEDAADEYKGNFEPTNLLQQQVDFCGNMEKIRALLPPLEKKKEKLLELKADEEQRKQTCLKQLEEQRQKVPSVFKEMHKFLEEKELSWLKHLADLEKDIKKEQEESMAGITKEITHYTDLVKEVETKCQQPVIEFLQDTRRIMSRCQEGQMRQQLEYAPGLEWKLRKSYPNTAVLKKVMEEFEGSIAQGPTKVYVTLDPDTAHPWLTLSEDLKSFRMGDEYRDLPDNPERFDIMPYVLGRERFSLGTHCWVVEVEKEGWAVGVARESLARKGCFIISPNKGIWAVGKDSFQPYPLLAFTSHGKIPLNLPHVPQKIRVYLDYEEGRVEFFDGDKDNLIFSFPPASFSGESIRPFFWVGDGDTVCSTESERKSTGS